MSMSMLLLDAVAVDVAVDVDVDVAGNELIKLGFYQDQSEGDIGATRPPSNSAVNVATTTKGKVARTTVTKTTTITTTTATTEKQ